MPARLCSTFRGEPNADHDRSAAVQTSSTDLAVAIILDLDPKPAKPVVDKPNSPGGKLPIQEFSQDLGKSNEDTRNEPINKVYSWELPPGTNAPADSTAENPLAKEATADPAKGFPSNSDVADDSQRDTCDQPSAKKEEKHIAGEEAEKAPAVHSETEKVSGVSQDPKGKQVTVVSKPPTTANQPIPAVPAETIASGKKEPKKAEDQQKKLAQAASDSSSGKGLPKPRPKTKDNIYDKEYLAIFHSIQTVRKFFNGLQLIV
ncbi:MAG: hypothetical protein P4M11_15485 [Candidatus Pacebacteria bacterium]|nr:hypothetical protein [Candidatus Paceibacterota bacterium]